MAKSWKHAWKIKKVYWRIILLKPTSDAHCMQRGTGSWYAEPGALATFNLQSQMELKPNNLNITELYTIQYYIIIYCIYYWWTATSPFDVFCMCSIWAAVEHILLCSCTFQASDRRGRHPNPKLEENTEEFFAWALHLACTCRRAGFEPKHLQALRWLGWCREGGLRKKSSNKELKKFGKLMQGWGQKLQHWVKSQ